MKTLVSIGDFSGHWSAPWRDAGWRTVRVDPKLQAGLALGDNDVCVGSTAQEWVRYVKHSSQHSKVDTLLMAPPCTDFSVSGAQYWDKKDYDGRTAAALEIVDACLELVKVLQPRVWMLENPVGRLPDLRPELGKPKLYVQPHHYAHFSDVPSADAYTKKTGLWGEFDHIALGVMQGNVQPERVCSQGSWLQQLGGSSERTKTLRSMTPQGLARACYMATTSQLYPGTYLWQEGISANWEHFA